jgi:RNA polymerase sigma factor (sigma-70 family)
MTDVPDARFLEQFARNGSEDAFAALVQRHIALVHSVALRRTANAQHAQDITQAVFVVLARKAGALGGKTVLPGWLYHTVRLTAANLQRAETRRVRPEQEAFMQSKLEESTPDALWRELSPQLDEAMAGLGTGERDALVLRYFQNKSMAEVRKFLGLEENTAQKRVSRALEKLRKFFMKRGVSSTTAIIAGAISANSVQAVPVTLAKSVTAVALAKGAAASTSTLTLIKGALKIMAWTKAKTAIVIGAGVLFAVGTTVLVERHIAAQQYTEAREPWSDAGASTPKSALQTLAWALTHDKIDRAQELMQWDEKGVEYGNPTLEHQIVLSSVLAPALKDIESFRILSVEPASQPNELIVKFEKSFRNKNIRPFTMTARLRRIGSQWRVVGKIEYYQNGSVSTWLPFTASF